ncbi:ShlB/FhaC/HecB family hemolysin secretion/activation protein [Planctomycetota bacterium]
MACRMGPTTLAMLAAVLLLGHVAWAGGAPGPDGPAFQVTGFVVSYGGVDDPKHALHGRAGELPTGDEIARFGIRLGEVADGYVGARPGAAAVSIQLGAAASHPKNRFYATAIRSVSQQVLAFFNRRGLVGVFVAPHPEDILEERAEGADGKVQVTLKDRRPKGRTTLRIVIWVGAVTEVRTLASGTRIPTAERVNHPGHEAIRLGSPIGPAEEGAPHRDVLLRREKLQRYIYYLSRHPSRRVDLAMSAADQPGGVVLDYLVTENKPWYAYVQASNTGTQFTRDWRERFGFVHNQLTGRDDILMLDYVTSGFDESHMILLSYEAPFFGCPGTRWRVYGSWSEYEASDVGLARESFEGESLTAGFELISNVVQLGRLFVDAVAGVRWEDHEVNDKTLGVTGNSNMWVPYAGFRFDRLTETASSWGSVILEGVYPNESRAELTELGRLFPDRRWAVVKFDAQHSYYLEPLLCPDAWRDPTSYRSSTLAHEIFLAFRGQHALGSRMIPQHETVAGGLYTVRGYPESVVAGDSAYIFTAEYRFHVPRIFKPQPPTKLPVFGSAFRWAPQQVYGRPDWDMVLRCFFDCGRVTNVHRQVFEVDETLKGAGVGVELRFKHHITVRCDYAVALEDVDTASRHVGSGNNRCHTVVTISF